MFNLNKPKCGTSKEWKQWEEQSKKSHPVKYFLSETFPIFFGRIKNRISDGIYWVKYRTMPRHKYHLVKTGLSPGYYDKDALILHACFNLLKDFVEVEKPFEHFEIKDDNNSILEHWKEISDIYQWWTVIRPKREEPNSPISDNWWEDPKVMEWALKCGDLEAACDKEDEEMLIRLMKVRLHLWT